MAVPKKRRSKAKKRTHRSLWKIHKPTMTPCTNCGQLTIAHHACSACGFYKGRQVLKIKPKKEDTNQD